MTPARAVSKGEDAPVSLPSFGEPGLQPGDRLGHDFAAYHVDAFIDTFPDVVDAVASLEGALHRP
ncbi:hypothetical protein [Nonomuraea sp. NPDC050691]|uniref:hypothetical protein n=1 Tax=Nonomuraea sp. NPDC050691 TaxID=3155661 RepID=UPI0033C246C6